MDSSDSAPEGHDPFQFDSNASCPFTGVTLSSLALYTHDTDDIALLDK